MDTTISTIFHAALALLAGGAIVLHVLCLLEGVGNWLDYWDLGESRDRKGRPFLHDFRDA